MPPTASKLEGDRPEDGSGVDWGQVVAKDFEAGDLFEVGGFFAAGDRPLEDDKGGVLEIVVMEAEEDLTRDTPKKLEPIICCSSKHRQQRDAQSRLPFFHT
ncbi:MAG: hypothetical protein AB4050_01475 [Synechococcus sp.]